MIAPRDPATNDPFWSVVHQRHPEAKLVLVAEQSATDEQVESMRPLVMEDPALIDIVPDEFDSWFRELWSDLVGTTANPEGYWTPGQELGYLDREALHAIEATSSADGPKIDGHRVLASAERVLSASGWSGIAVSGGQVPRVSASKELPHHTETIEVVYVPGRERLAMAGAWRELNVGRSAADIGLEDHV